MPFFVDGVGVAENPRQLALGFHVVTALDSIPEEIFGLEPDQIEGVELLRPPGT